MPILTMDFTADDSMYISSSDAKDVAIKSSNALVAGAGVLWEIDGLHPYALPGTAEIAAPVDSCIGLIYDGSNYYFWGSYSKIYITSIGGAATDISGASSPYGSIGYLTGITIWRNLIFGGLIIMAPGNTVHPPQVYDSGTGLMIDLPNWPTGYGCGFLVAFKSYLIAYIIYPLAGAIKYSRVLWGQQVSDSGSVPGSWDVTNPANDAGQLDLVETEGKLTAAVVMGNAIYVYKNSSIYRQTWVGGQNVFKFDLFSRAIGAVAGLTVVNFITDQGERQFFLGENSFYIHDGVKITDIGYGSVTKEIFNLTGVSIKTIHAQVFLFRSEIHVYVPTSSPYGTRTYIWNWRHNKWSPPIVETTKYITGCLGGAIANVSPDVFLVEDFVTANQTHRAFVDLTTVKTHTITRTGLTLPIPDGAGGVISGDNLFKSVVRIWPKIYSPSGGTLKFYVGSQLMPGGTVTWSAVYSMTIGGTGDNKPFMDIEPVATRFGAIKFEFTTTNVTGNWCFVSVDIEYSVIGEATQ